MLRAPVATEAMTATSFMNSGRRFDRSNTSTAPIAGTMISIDRIGKPSASPCIRARSDR